MLSQFHWSHNAHSSKPLCTIKNVIPNYKNNIILIFLPSQRHPVAIMEHMRPHQRLPAVLISFVADDKCYKRSTLTPVIWCTLLYLIVLLGICWCYRATSNSFSFRREYCSTTVSRQEGDPAADRNTDRYERFVSEISCVLRTKKD